VKKKIGLAIGIFREDGPGDPNSQDIVGVRKIVKGQTNQEKKKKTGDIQGGGLAKPQKPQKNPKHGLFLLVGRKPQHEQTGGPHQHGSTTHGGVFFLKNPVL